MPDLKLLLFSLMLLFAACAPPPQRAARSEAPIRVLVYNIHAGKNAAGEPNLDRVADVVRESEADVVFLQEVDRGTERSGHEDQIATLERLTGLHDAFGASLEHFQGGQYGIAVLSRWPIVADTVHPLPVQPVQDRAGGSHEPRIALHAVVQAPGGRLHLLDTHLDPSRDDFWRMQEVRQVHEIAEALRASGERVLVGGDFNSEPGSATIQHMTTDGWQDTWAACGTGEGFSFPSDTPVKRIDYLFLPEGMSCSAATVVNTDASDHRPVRFVVTGH